MLKYIRAKFRRLTVWINQKWEDYQCRKFNIESYDGPLTRKGKAKDLEDNSTVTQYHYPEGKKD